MIEVARPWRTNFPNHDRLTPESGYSSKVGVAETIAIGGRSGLVPVVTHMKAQGREQGTAPALLQMMSEATAKGTYVAADVYPYLAGQSGLAALLIPGWALDGGREAMLKRFANPAERARIIKDAEEAMAARFGGPQGVYATGHSKELVAAMKEFGVSSPGEALLRLLETVRWRRDPALRRGERPGRDSEASERVGRLRLRRGRRRRDAPPLLRQLPAGAGPLRPGAAGTDLGGCGPQDDGVASRDDRPRQSRPAGAGHGGRHRRLRSECRSSIMRRSRRRPRCRTGMRHVLVNGKLALQGWRGHRREGRGGAAARPARAEPPDERGIARKVSGRTRRFRGRCEPQRRAGPAQRVPRGRSGCSIAPRRRRSR